MTQLGCLIMGVGGLQLSAEERDLLNHPFIGGIILFARNYESREQLIELCKQVRAARKNPVLITVDQEGGRVQRFINDFTRLPAVSRFGKLYDRDPEQALDLAKDGAWLMATELLSAGVDLSFAPVLDLDRGLSTVIGERAFHPNPEIVARLASAFLRGMNEAGMSATAKHFPGHGSITVDSHLAIPTDPRPYAEIAREDMVPFQSLIAAGIQTIMAAHIIFPQIDTRAVGFSAVWLKDILRKQLNFKGVIVSDDLCMEGANISSLYEDRVQAAREAGCDFTMICNDTQGVIQVLDNLSYTSYLVDEDKWRPLQGKGQEFQQQTQRKQGIQSALAVLDTLTNG